MGKSAPSPPAQPDPKETAKAQGAANVDTAVAQSLLNMYNQSSPYGNVTYNQIGTDMVGTGDEQREVPRYEQITTLAPSQQRQLDLTNQLSEQALGVGNTAFSNVSGQMQQPFNPEGLPPINGNASDVRNQVTNDLYNTQTGRLDDRFGRQEEALRNRLANQGIAEGSDAYSAAMSDFNYGKNDAYNSAMATALSQGTSTAQAENAMNLANRQQGYQEQSYERSLPLNELSALLGFSGGVQNPSFNPTPQTGVANTDIAGITNNAYANQMAGYSAQMQQQNAMMGGLMGLGGSIGSALILSDARMKEDVSYVGMLSNGLPVYSFRYKGSNVPQIGLMAQDVEKVKPEAVVEINGIKHVNYAEAVQ